MLLCKTLGFFSFWQDFYLCCGFFPGEVSQLRWADLTAYWHREHFTFWSCPQSYSGYYLIPMWAGTAENLLFLFFLGFFLLFFFLLDSLIFHHFNELGDKNAIAACKRKVHNGSLLVIIQKWLTFLLIKDPIGWNCLILCCPLCPPPQNTHRNPQIYKILHFCSLKTLYLKSCVLKETINHELCPWMRFLVLVLHTPLFLSS